MTKEQLAIEVIERLKKEYPDAGCTLDYDQAWKLLVSVRLAAQCTDARVNVVVEDLYARYPDVEALAAADVEDIERIVRPCGLGKSKARDISACMKILKEEYDGKIPRDPPDQPYRPCGWNQGSKESGNGTVEDHSTGGRERFLPPAGISRKRYLHGQDKAIL